MVCPSVVGFSARITSCTPSATLGKSSRIFNISRRDVVHRGEHSLKDVVHSPVFVRLLHGDEIASLGDDAHLSPIPAGVATDLADLFFREIGALFTESNVLFHRNNGFRELFRLLLRLSQDMKRHALRRLGSDPRKPLQFAD